MKLLSTIILEQSLQDVREALISIGAIGLTVTVVKDFAPKNSHTEFYRSEVYVIEYIGKIKLEAFIADNMEDTAIKVIVAACESCHESEQIICFFEMSQCVRVHNSDIVTDHNN